MVYDFLFETDSFFGFMIFFCYVISGGIVMFLSVIYVFK